MNEIREEVKSNSEIAFHYTIGYPTHDIIETFARENKVDLIVMGTTGATGLKKFLFGSNTTLVINKSSRPVLAVPEEVEFKQITKIIYASDLTHLDDEIKILAAYASLFDASILVLHVTPLHTTKEFEEIENTIPRLKEVANYPKISFHILKHDEPAEAIDNFVTDQKADMLAMFTHKLDFIEKLSQAGLTRQLAFHSHVPMLLFNKNTLTSKFL